MMLDVIIKGAPDTVEVDGTSVAIHTGFRTHLLAADLMEHDPKSPTTRARLLNLLFSERDGRLPRYVVLHAAEVLTAAIEWHTAAWGLISYGGSSRKKRRVFDWRADAGIVAADFAHIYHIDITARETQLHWYRFVALFLALARMPNALISQAVQARSPLTGRVSTVERDAHQTQAKAWALPLTEDEIRARALRDF